ncbi:MULTISPECIES: cation transporter [unclassified Corynebacterium]|uniref:cation transporter n=1 Tax=unclassified Corynebacterium TaxID=2624378 RepID=UPI0008A57B1A|nr:MULTISPECIES: cation transporter [unclassified Corynebacterium]OFK65251.1 cobalt transporter [Corynebacterium sp. HMSC076G08]OFK68056.1 cobalt transporter [Corynebacterium sp. HMSC074A09]
MSQELSSSTLNARARRIVAWVAALNLLGFFGEFIIAAFIGSAALFADAADFLEDFLINALVLLALRWSAEGRRKASYGLAGLILIPALASYGMAIWKIITGAVPEPLTLSGTAVAAMLINLLCAVLLVQLRHGSALTRGAWLAARNDVAANILILGAGLLMLVWASPWPDIVVGLIIGTINLRAAAEVFEQARAEDPEIEED